MKIQKQSYMTKQTIINIIKKLDDISPNDEFGNEETICMFLSIGKIPVLIVKHAKARAGSVQFNNFIFNKKRKREV